MWTGRPEKTIYQYPRAKTFAERHACVRESMWAAAESIRMEKKLTETRRSWRITCATTPK